MGTLGSIASSTEVYTKTEADSAIDEAGGAVDATTLVKGVIQLAGDLAGTAAAPTVPGLATKEASIAAGTTSQYWRGDKSWQTLDKSAVGLANADNTSDANKPISTATQTALDNKQGLDSDLTAIAGLSPSNDDLLQRKAGAWTNRTPAQVKTDLALTKSDVGLGNVDNTSDANKPVSSATQTALNAKAPLVSPSFTTPALGVATATSLAATGALTSSGTAGIGYAAGAGGTVTQATNKATAVTLNKITGEVVLTAAALAAGAIVTFVLNNSTIVAADIIVCNHVTTGTFGAYLVNARATGAGTASIAVRNNSAGSLSEAIAIRFAVIKAATT